MLWRIVFNFRFFNGEKNWNVLGVFVILMFGVKLEILFWDKFVKIVIVFIEIRCNGFWL